MAEDFGVIFSEIRIRSVSLNALYSYSAHNNKWNFSMVCASLSLNERVTKSSIYHCEY